MVGPGARRFWRSPAPYLMALGAAIVLAPHVWWMLTQSGASVQFAERRRQEEAKQDQFKLTVGAAHDLSGFDPGFPSRG